MTYQTSYIPMENPFHSKPKSYYIAFLVLIICNVFFLYKFQTIGHTQSDSMRYINWNMKSLRKSALLDAPQNRQDVLEASLNETNSIDFYKKIKIEAFCEKKVRIGGEKDGGKFVCNPENVREKCTLMSLGINNSIQYDEEIYKATGGSCSILGADKDVQNATTIGKYYEIKGQLFVGKIPEELTIPSMMKGSGKTDVELLKIDIEGGEFAGLEPLIQEYYVCQIFIEIHGTPAQHLGMLQILGKYGFRIFNIEPNSLWLQGCEYSLINELCMAQFGVVPLAINIPMAQDF